jgi:hypothetical protein
MLARISSITTMKLAISALEEAAVGLEKVILKPTF